MTRSQGQRRALPLLVCCLAGLGLAAARELLGDSPHVIEGKTIVMEMENADRSHHTLLAVRTAEGKKVLLQVPEGQHTHGLYTGMHIRASGRWAAGQQQGKHHGSSGAAAAAAAAAAGGAAGAAGTSSPQFVASELVTSGAAFAAAEPQLTRAAAHGGDGVAAAAAGGPGAGVQAAVFTVNKLVKREVRTIFIPIAGLRDNGAACDGTDLPEFTATQVRQAAFEEVNPSGVTIGSTYNRCSYGQTKLNTKNSMVADLVKLPCSGNTNGVAWTFSKCDYDDFNGYADAADAILASRGINVSDYDHHVYLIPPSQCGFVGLGYVGCDGSYECRSWIGADFWTTPAAIAHELGHNLFLAHAGAMNQQGVFDEYADLSGIMGYCCSERCPNTAHAWQLGWVNLQQLDGSSLRPGTSLTLTIASQSGGPKRGLGSGLRIVPSWLPNWRQTTEPIYVGYRTKWGGDNNTNSNVFGKLHIYTANISNTFDPQVSAWKSSLTTPADSWTHPTAGLVIRMRQARPGTALLSVCRKGGPETLQSCQAGADRDCNGLVGAKDPVCARLFKRLRATKLQPEPMKRRPV